MRHLTSVASQLPGRALASPGRGSAWHRVWARLSTCGASICHFSRPFPHPESPPAAQISHTNRKHLSSLSFRGEAAHRWSQFKAWVPLLVSVVVHRLGETCCTWTQPDPWLGGGPSIDLAPLRSKVVLSVMLCVCVCVSLCVHTHVLCQKRTHGAGLFWGTYSLTYWVMSRAARRDRNRQHYIEETQSRCPGAEGGPLALSASVRFTSCLCQKKRSTRVRVTEAARPGSIP